MKRPSSRRVTLLQADGRSSEAYRLDHVFVGRGPLGKGALLDAMVQELEKPGPGLRLLRGQIVHLQIARVAHDQAMIGVEHAQALGHVAQGHVEARILSAQLLLALLEQLVLLRQARVELLPVAGGPTRHARGFSAAARRRAT